jgi:RNA polymerase sigma factor (sigma-70 family)
MNDWELLQAWANNRSDSAFAELVRRYVDLVHAAALRQVADPELARDVAQAVFLALSQKAGSLSRHVILGGWLLRTTRYVAARAQRTEQRRRHRETAALMDSLTSDSPATPDHWTEVEPQLDAALAALSTGDRDLVALRYFERKSMAEVGTRLGIGEDTAKKRVSRAVERLRHHLTKRGVVLTLAGLTGLLSQLPTNAAPVGLATAITASMVGGTSAPTVAELTRLALRDGMVARIGTVAPWAIVLLVLSLVGFRAALTVGRDSDSPTAQAGADDGATSAVTAAVEASISEPVAASKILLSVRSAESDQPVQASVRWADFRKDGGLIEARTDRSGVIELPFVPTPRAPLVVNISAPAHVPVEVTWNPHELTGSTLVYTCRLRRGHRLRGLVQNEAGQPVADAKIQFTLYRDLGRLGRERISLSASQTSLHSAANGHFETDQLPAPILLAGALKLTATHPEYAPTTLHQLQAAEWDTYLTVLMVPGIEISGNVSDESQLPIAGAHVHLSEAASAITDTDGQFRLPPLPSSYAGNAVQLEAIAPGFQKTAQTISLTNRTANLSFILKPADPLAPPPTSGNLVGPVLVTLSGSAVDAASGEPLPSFGISVANRDHLLPRQVAEWVGEGQDGHFEWQVNRRHFGAFHSDFVLQATADGYRPLISRTFSQNETNVVAEFHLVKAPALTGQVVLPDGMPAAEALVALGGPGFQVMVAPNDSIDVSGPQAPVLTDRYGRFSLPRWPTASKVYAFSHGHFGQAEVERLGREPLRLSAWGKISGRVERSGQPVADQWVQLGPRHPFTPQREGLHFYSGSRMTHIRLDGRFQFDSVPPGEAVVELSHHHQVGPRSGTKVLIERQTVAVESGQVTEVVFTSAGRTVVGQLTLSQPVAGHRWAEELELLVPLEAPADADPDGADLRQHLLTLKADGSFRVDDVPPGQYRLRLAVQIPYDDNDETGAARGPTRPKIGRLELPVTIPEAPEGDTSAVDLGRILIPVNPTQPE